MKRPDKTDSRQLELPVKKPEASAIGGETRLKVIDLLQPELNKSRNTQLSFVIYLLRKELNADIITLQESELNMMRKLGIMIKYRNDGGTNIPLDAYEIPIVYPDGIDGSLTVDKAHPEMFSFDKNCRRGEDKQIKKA